MPTIKQLPVATAVGGSDLLPVSQSGLTRSVAVSTLLSNTQPLLSLAQGTLLGRVSAGLGAPEAVSVGTGLSVQSGTAIATGADHIGFTLATSLLADDEVVLNSGAAPRRLAATQLRSLFSAGPGVQIDSSGTISVTATSTPGGVVGAGPKGDTGAQGATGQGFTFRGAWQANTAYSPYDVVTIGGQTYVAVSAVPASSTFLSASWSLVAAQGATGPIGATGPAGPTVLATSNLPGVVRPGAGLVVSADGTLNLSSINLGLLSQGSATIGQLLSWSGTGWTPTTPTASVTLTGVAPITVSSGVISIGQSGAIAGQVLTWNGTAWTPQPPPTGGGAAVGTAIPLADGVAVAGNATAASREDHRHPTDQTRAPLASPVFTTSITLPIWTTATRPASPTIGTEGFASDTSRRETYTSTGWVQYVRVTDIPAANGQLLGGSVSGGTASPVVIGSGLTLAGGTLSAVSASTAPSVSGVTIDGNAIAATPSIPYQMSATDRVVDVNKTTGTATKILLPSSPTLWVEYTVVDGKGDAGTNNILLALASGGSINGQPSFLLNANNDAVTLRAVGATVWRVV